MEMEKGKRCRDVARMDEEGSIEIVANKEDLIYDNNNGLVEHWNIERLLNQSDLIKGVQVAEGSSPLSMHIQNLASFTGSVNRPRTTRDSGLRPKELADEHLSSEIRTSRDVQEAHGKILG